jgi:hypothetical protein
MAGILMFKVALCLEYLRILPVSKRGYRLFVKMVLVFAVAAHFTFTIVLLFNCSPVSKPNILKCNSLGSLSDCITDEEVLETTDPREMLAKRTCQFQLISYGHSLRLHHFPDTNSFPL